MRLLEYQSRRLLAEYSLPFGEWVTVSSSSAAELEARKIGGPVMIKAQGPFGGRGKAGLVQSEEMQISCLTESAERV